MRPPRGAADVIVVSRLPIHVGNLLRALGSFSRTHWVGRRFPYRMGLLTAPAIVAAELVGLFGAYRTRMSRARPVVVVHFVSLDAVAAYVFRFFTGCRVFLYAIGSDIQGDKGRFEKAFLRWALRGSDLVLCTNRRMAARAKGLGGDEVLVLPTPFEPFAVAESEKTFDVATVGALIPVKRQMMLMQSLGHFQSPPKVALVGDGPLRKELEEEGAKHPGADVVFLGRVPHSEVPSILARSKVYVQCSSMEGMPLAVLEAAWAGLPLVVVSGEYASDLVEMYGLDVKIAERSPEALAAAISERLQGYAGASASASRNRDALARYASDWTSKAEEMVRSHG